MKRISISFIALFISVLSLFGQGSENNTVSLVVDGQGRTKEEAVSNALRSAIEQAFGTFVSANTSLVNDELVKDEIVTVSSGNIQSYKELSAVRFEDGVNSVTLSAVVSINNLVSYAKAKGSSCEFAGASFAMNMKMRKLNKENEALALEHMLVKLDELSKVMFDMSINAGEPYKESFENSSSIEKADVNSYMIPITIHFNSNQNTKAFYNTLFETLEALSLSEKEQHDYVKNNDMFFYLTLTEPVGVVYGKKEVVREKTFCLRNDPKSFIMKLDFLINDAILSNIIKPDGTDLQYRILGKLMHSEVYVKEMEKYGQVFSVNDRSSLLHLNKVLVVKRDPDKCDNIEIVSNYPLNTTAILNLSINNRYIFMGTRYLDGVAGQANVSDNRIGHDVLNLIEGLFSYPIQGSRIFDFCLTLPILESELMNLVGFSIVRKEENVEIEDNYWGLRMLDETHRPKWEGKEYRAFEEWASAVLSRRCNSKMEGTVYLSTIIETDGKLIIKNIFSHFPLMHDEVIEMVRRSSTEWTPGTDENGNPIRVGNVFSIKFKHE